MSMEMDDSFANRKTRVHGMQNCRRTLTEIGERSEIPTIRCSGMKNCRQMIKTIADSSAFQTTRSREMRNSRQKLTKIEDSSANLKIPVHGTHSCRQTLMRIADSSTVSGDAVLRNAELSSKANEDERQFCKPQGSCSWNAELSSYVNGHLR